MPEGRSIVIATWSWSTEEGRHRLLHRLRLLVGDHVSRLVHHGRLGLRQQFLPAVQIRQRDQGVIAAYLGGSIETKGERRLRLAEDVLPSEL